jgi:hypothetical protein
MSFIIMSDPSPTYRQIDESREPIESPHARPVTPDESESFDQDDNDFSRIKIRSPSIPIASGRPSRTLSEILLDEEEVMADVRDFAMFTRIVDGITKAQQGTRDCRWRHENDVSLQHVYKARNEDRKDSLVHWKLPQKLRMNLPTSLPLDIFSQVNNEYVPQEEDGNDNEDLFTLEL